MTRDERDRLAAQYALGLLEGDEAQATETLLHTDRDFERAVARWRERFAEFDAQAPSLAPPSGPRARIESDLPASPGAMRRPAAVPPAADTVAPRCAAAQPRLLARRGPCRRLREPCARRRPSRRWADARAAAAGLRRGAARRTTPAPRLFAVNAFADGSAELVPLEGVSIPAGRSLELWTFARGTAAPPVSVGVLDQARAVRFRLDRLPRVAPSQLFAISVEPQGGSPTGLPTGPVLMKGTASSAL